MPIGEIDFNVNGYYNSGFYVEPDNMIHQPSFAEVGSSLHWTSASGNLTASVFGRSMGNKRAITYVGTQSSGAQLVQYAEPRVYRITRGYKELSNEMQVHTGAVVAFEFRDAYPVALARSRPRMRILTRRLAIRFPIPRALPAIT